MTIQKTYEKTHPWISFAVDLQRTGTRLWLLLGEAASKCDHIAGVALRPETADALHRLYLAKGALASTAIEGNTLSEQEVLEHLDGKLQLPKSREYLGKEIDNIVSACNSVGKQLVAGNLALTPQAICDFNAMVLDGLDLEDGAVPGKIRERGVVVGRVYRGAPAEDCEYLLDRLCEWLNEIGTPQGLGPTHTAIIKAVIAHLYLAWIHPFDDGNGRTARLVELLLLLSAGVPTPAAHLLSNHYNHTRTEYYRQLDGASKSGGDVVPFLEYAVQGFVDGLHEQLRAIREEQLIVAWRDLVYSRFRDKSQPSVRHRNLVLDLSLQKKPVPVAEISGLTPRLAQAYALLSMRTLIRDVRQLVDDQLLEVTSEGVQANLKLIWAFVPKRLASPS